MCQNNKCISCIQRMQKIVTTKRFIAQDVFGGFEQSQKCPQRVGKVFDIANPNFLLRHVEEMSDTLLLVFNECWCQTQVSDTTCFLHRSGRGRVSQMFDLVMYIFLIFIPRPAQRGSCPPLTVSRQYPKCRNYPELHDYNRMSNLEFPSPRVEVRSCILQLEIYLGFCNWTKNLYHSELILCVGFLVDIHNHTGTI